MIIKFDLFFRKIIQYFRFDFINIFKIEQIEKNMSFKKILVAALLVLGVVSVNPVVKETADFNAKLQKLLGNINLKSEPNISLLA